MIVRKTRLIKMMNYVFIVVLHSHHCKTNKSGLSVRVVKDGYIRHATIFSILKNAFKFNMFVLVVALSKEFLIHAMLMNN